MGISGCPDILETESIKAGAGGAKGPEAGGNGEGGWGRVGRAGQVMVQIGVPAVTVAPISTASPLTVPAR